MKKELQEKLQEELKRVEKCLKDAQEKESGYQTRVGRGIPTSKPTYFGDMADRFLVRARARHFWVRWRMAVKALQRRRMRLQKVLKISSPPAAEGLRGANKAQAIVDSFAGNWEPKYSYKKASTNNEFNAEVYFDAD